MFATVLWAAGALQARQPPTRLARYTPDPIAPLAQPSRSRLARHPVAQLAAENSRVAGGSTQIAVAKPVREYQFEATVSRPLGLQLEESEGSVVVTSVYNGSNAALAGIEAGDRIVATSASMGDAMWEKRTLDGVQAAIQTRVDGNVRLRLARVVTPGRWRPGAWERTLTDEFEVELPKPLGLALRQACRPARGAQCSGAAAAAGSSSGAAGPEPATWVEVEAVEAGGAAAASGQIRSGDVVVATSASVGNLMWEKRSLEGVLSAISTRLFYAPTVTIRFRRTGRLGAWTSELVEIAKGERAALSAAALASYRLDRRAVRIGGVGEPASKAVRELCALALTRFGRRSPAYRSGAERGPSEDNIDAVFGAAARVLEGAAEAIAAEASAKDAAVSPAEAGEVAADGGGGAPGRSEVAAALASEAALAYRDGSGRELASLIAMWRRLRLSPLRFDARLTNLFMAAALRCGAPRLARAFFSDATSPASEAVVVRPRGAAAVVAPDAYLYNTLIKAHSVAGERAEAEAVLQRMRAEAVPPDTYTFNTLMSVCAKAGDRQGMLRYFKALDEGGLKPTIDSWNVVLDFCSRARQPAQASEVLRRMRAGGIEPDAVAYASIITAHVRAGGAGGVDAASRVLDEALASAVPLDAPVFNALLGGYATQLRWFDALELLRAMRTRGPRPDSVSYGLVLRACLRARAAEAASAVLELMTADQEPISVRAFAMVLSTYANGGQVAEALALLKRMQEAGVPPNRYIFSAMMEACINGGQPETALAVFEQMTGQGISPDVVSYTLLVRAHATPQTSRADHVPEAELRSAFATVKAMVDAGVKPNVVTYNALLAGCLLPAEPAGEPRYQAALSVVKEMLAARVSPTKRTFQSLVAAPGPRLPNGGRGGGFKPKPAPARPPARVTLERVRYLAALMREFRSARRQLDGVVFLEVLSAAATGAASREGGGLAEEAVALGLEVIAARRTGREDANPALFDLGKVHLAQAPPLEAAIEAAAAAGVEI